MDKWNHWYKSLKPGTSPSEFRYGNTITYSKGYEYLKSCSQIEDWGCGTGGFKTAFKGESFKYIGVDGSDTPFADMKVDLLTYKSVTTGLYMRHVLEHNYQWRQILANALDSFTEKMCLVLFTPFVDTETQLAHNLQHGVDVPDLAFKRSDITDMLDSRGIDYHIETISTSTGYGVEHVLYLNKKWLAFYTVFIGDSSHIANVIPEVPSPLYACYYYTNNTDTYAALQKTTWIPKLLDAKPIDETDGCFLAKKVKICPHLFPDLSAYSNTCFFDTKLTYPMVVSAVESSVGRSLYTVRRHDFIEPSVWMEFNESMLQTRYRQHEHQYRSYIESQIQNGLQERTDTHLSCGFILRHMCEDTTILNDTWYSHIEKCGIQDQISFFFVKQLFPGKISVFTDDPMPGFAALWRRN